MPCMMMPPKLVLPKLPFMKLSSRCSGLWSSEASQNSRMDSRDTANFGPSMLSPAFRSSKLVVMIIPPRLLVLFGPDGPAAAGTDHVGMLVEKDVVVHHEQP